MTSESRTLRYLYYTDWLACFACIAGVQSPRNATTESNDSESSTNRKELNYNSHTLATISEIRHLFQFQELDKTLPKESKWIICEAEIIQSLQKNCY